MSTVTLPPEIDRKLEQMFDFSSKSKTELVVDALIFYIQQAQKKQSSYELGEDLFGRHGSSKGNLSQNYKLILKEKIRDKFRSH